MPETLNPNVLDTIPESHRGREKQPPRFADDVSKAIEGHRHYFAEDANRDPGKAPLYGIKLEDVSKAASVRSALAEAAKVHGVTVRTWDLTKAEPAKPVIAFRVTSLERKVREPKPTTPEQDAAGATGEPVAAGSPANPGGPTA